MPMCSSTVVRPVGVQPADDVGVDLVDAPAGMTLVVVVTQAGRPVELRADEVHPVPAAGEALPQPDPVPARHLGALGDRVAERHHPYPAVGLRAGRTDETGQSDGRQYSDRGHEDGQGQAFHERSDTDHDRLSLGRNRSSRMLTKTFRNETRSDRGVMALTCISGLKVSRCHPDDERPAQTDPGPGGGRDGGPGGVQRGRRPHVGVPRLRRHPGASMACSCGCRNSVARSTRLIRRIRRC